MLLALAAVSFVASLVAAHVLFPLYSVNRDDSVYVAMARLIERGEVTLDAQEHDAFRPWASAERGDRIVMKYAPPWPALLAASDLVLGSMRAAAALTAAAATLLVGLFATEALRDAAAGRVAAALFALSPFVVIQSGTFLPYLFEVALGLAFAWLALTGVRRDGAGRLVAAGVALGVAAFARPFDAVLFGLPLAVVLMGTGGGWRALVGRPVRLVLLGAAPVLVVFLAYNAVVMGSPLRPSYLVTGDSDGFGFGRRGVFDALTIRFDPADGVAATAASLRWLVGWSFGGGVLAALALLATWRRRGHPWPVLGLAVTFTLGYVAFWGPHAVTREWPGAATLGPFYHLPVLVPLVVFGAAALMDLWRHGRRGRRAAVVAAGAMVALTAWSSSDKVRTNLDVRDDFRAVRDHVAGLDLESALLFLPRRGDRGYESTTPFLENRPDLDQPVLYAEQRGPEDLALLDRYPDRTPYRLSQELDSDRSTSGLVTTTRLRVERGREVQLRIRVRNPGPHAAVTTYLHDGRVTYRRPLDATSQAGRVYDVAWTVAADGPPSDRDSGRIRLGASSPEGVVAVGVAFGGRPGAPRLRVERRFPFRVLHDGSAEIEVLRPGRGFRAPPRHRGRGWAEAHVDHVVAELP